MDNDVIRSILRNFSTPRTMKLNIWEAATPVIVAFTGLVTFAAVFVGYLWIQRRAVRDAMAAPQNARQATRQEEESEEEETSEDAIIKQWPMDNGVLKDPNTNLSEKELDAVNFCGHIPSQVKKAQVKATQKKIEEEMTEEMKEQERDIQRKQMEAIFKLMEEQKDKFGLDTVEDMNEQMKLYVC